MSTVVPKLMYSSNKHGDFPIWEITTETGRKIYYERIHYPGLVPIGRLDTFKLGSGTIEVYDVVKLQRNSNSNPKILRAVDGYVAPFSWYEKDKTYTGKDPVSNLPENDSDIYSNDDDTETGRRVSYAGDEYDLDVYSDGDY